MCVCVCVCERERERERTRKTGELESKADGQNESGRQRVKQEARSTN